MKDRFEYSIRIFGDKDLIRERIKKSEKMISVPVPKQKPEETSRKELISFMNEHFNPFFNFIVKHANVIEVGNLSKKPEKWKDKRIILNASCLVDKNKVKALRDVLEKIDETRYFSVMLTGPRTTSVLMGEKK